MQWLLYNAMAAGCSNDVSVTTDSDCDHVVSVKSVSDSDWYDGCQWAQTVPNNWRSYIEITVTN